MKQTRNTYRVGVKVVAALALAGLFAAGLALAGSTTVTLSDSGPQPATVTVQWGDTVNFANSDDAPHGITIPRIAFASPSIPAGQSWAQVFNGQSGNYLFRQVEGRPFLGMVVVQLGGKVTMTAKPTAVVYGKRVTFEGTTLPGYRVALEQQVMGQASQWAEVLTVAADGDGKWSASLAPKLGARYRATAAVGQLRSTAVLVDVQPSVVLTALRGARKDKQVAVRARIVPAGAANTADLERYDRQRRLWQREQRAAVDRAGRVTFRWKAVKGRSQLRVQLHRFGLKTGFAATTSKPVTVNVP